jgi:putative sigma-54 modulation protein
MLFTISGRHLEITDAIRSYAEDKSSKLPRYYNSITSVEFVLEGNEGGNQAVEVIARGEHSNVFVASETGSDIYACIDIALHKLERQLRRKKEKQRNNKHIAGAGEYVAPVEEAEETDEEMSEELS